MISEMKDTAAWSKPQSHPIIRLHALRGKKIPVKLRMTHER